MKKWLEIIILFTVDLLTITIILELSILIRKHLLPSFIGFPEFAGESIITYWWIFPIWISFFAYEGLFTKRFSLWDEVKQLWRATFFSAVTVFSILFLGKMAENYSRTVIGLTGLISLFVFPAIRINAKKILRRMGILRSKVLIIGAGKRGTLVARALKEETNLGYKVVGFLDDNPEKAGKLIDGVKVHKGIDKAERYIGRSGMNTIVIAIPGASK